MKSTVPKPPKESVSYPPPPPNPFELPRLTQPGAPPPPEVAIKLPPLPPDVTRRATLLLYVGSKLQLAEGVNGTQHLSSNVKKREIQFEESKSDSSSNSAQKRQEKPPINENFLSVQNLAKQRTTLPERRQSKLEIL